MGAAAVVIPVGPGAVEAARAADALASVQAWMPGAECALVADEPRLVRGLGAAVLRNPRHGFGIGTLGGTCTATLAGLRWARERDAAWVLRLDADALVIGPLTVTFEPGDGVVGSCFRTCNGEERDFTPWAGAVRAHGERVWRFEHPPFRGLRVMPAEPSIRRAVRRALAAGYAPGQHCLAGGCAISRTFLDALAGAGWLRRERRWLLALLGDDVMLGVLAAALGFGLRDDPAVFGLRHIGLADTPQRLVERGFGVVHSLKAPGEEAARAYFAGLRP